MAAGGIPAPTGSGGNGHKKTEIKIRLPEQIRAGVYANSMMVHHTGDEFVMDFAMVIGGGGSVVARVIASPAHMKRIVAALNDNIKKYEAAHGSIKSAPAGPPPSFGFRSPVGPDE